MTVLFATVRFEYSRIMSTGRIAWWFVLAGFPALIAGLIRVFPLSNASEEFDSHFFWAIAMYLLVPCITCAKRIMKPNPRVQISMYYVLSGGVIRRINNIRINI